MTESLSEKIETRLLNRVSSPGQYIGGEVNQIKKEWTPGDVTIALGFPDTYAIGMSHLGLAILYRILNGLDGVIAERVYCPWIDAETIMRDEGIPLFSWESRKPIREFDIFAISLQHELCFTNVLYMLDMAGIPFRSADRDESYPLIMAGGPIADSAEPVADFFDLILLSDGEEASADVVQAYGRLRDAKLSRREILVELAREFPFVYVPSLYAVTYGEDGMIASFEPTEDGVPKCVERAVVQDLDKAEFPVAPIVSHVETPHDRIAIEIMRGCPQRCAFCHAGHTKGKLRYRSVDTIVDLAWQSYLNTGHDTISLLSLSTSDYPDLKELLEKLYARFEGKHVSISLPSLRVDKQLKDVPSQIVGVRREGLTIAVETASDVIRKAIGKKVTDDDLFDTIRAAYEAGWRKVKLYFMIGFPGETEEDLLGILELAKKISWLRREVAGQAASVNVAISWLVPKPHTPFGFIAQQPVSYFEKAKYMLIDAKRQLRRVPVSLKFHHMERSMLEAVFARGDRRLGKVIETVYAKGAKFDSWDECFDYQQYLDAMVECGIDYAFYAQRERGEDEILPWDHLAGKNREAMYRRWKRIEEKLNAADDRVEE